ncbi:hypothetical protein IVB30_22655 [Bradyrhizobium sp. 200]|uniref:hypothetical protein n=1 Tax=Bradyrhizobium sp. 200 TaxID=2782665 RepID=UPI001FFF7E66|nr:hypothetical protein [Bradyrhizobium sp. 200]UPJ53862.1 hypothetical protein IVB30_22655 [Bradyrhizobium sp. 200]
MIYARSSRRGNHAHYCCYFWSGVAAASSGRKLRDGRAWRYLQKPPGGGRPLRLAASAQYGMPYRGTANQLQLIMPADALSTADTVASAKVVTASAMRNLSGMMLSCFRHVSDVRLLSSERRDCRSCLPVRIQGMVRMQASRIRELVATQPQGTGCGLRFAADGVGGRLGDGDLRLHLFALGVPLYRALQGIMA